MRTAVAALLIVGFSVAGASGDHRTAKRYPRVYGNTGRPYGPTQAQYQYERRYGRPWHGSGGERRPRVGGYTYAPARYYRSPAWYGWDYPVVGGVVGPPGFYDYGPVYSNIPMAPLRMQAYPQWIGRDPFYNDVLRRAQLENELRWKMPLLLNPSTEKMKRRRLDPSTPAAKLRSLRAQAQGDVHMKRQDYHKAYERYKAAASVAPDRAEAHFRTAIALAAIGRLDSAVIYLKRGLQVDPDLPVTGVSLGRVFGRDNDLAKTGTIGRATAWAKEDIRDPDRLFLLGVLLHFDNHPDKSAVLFEAAYRLKGGGDHLRAFLATPQYVKLRKSPAKVASSKKPGGNGIVEIKPPLPPIEPRKDQRNPPPIVPPLPRP